MHFKLVLLAAHIGFALATPAGSGLTDTDNAVQARDAPQGDKAASSYGDGSYDAKKDDGYDKSDKSPAYDDGSWTPTKYDGKGKSDNGYGYNKDGDHKDGSYNKGYDSKDHKDDAYPHGQDSYNPGHLQQDTDQKTGSGPSDPPHDVNKQWDGGNSNYYGQDKGKYDNSHYDQKGKDYGQPHKDDHSGDWSNKQWGQDDYKPKGYDKGYSDNHDEHAKGYDKGYAPKYDQDSYKPKGVDDHHCPDRQHAVPFHRPNDEHDIIGYFFEHQEPQTYHLFAIYNEHTDQYFYTIDLAEKIIYMKQFGFEKDKGIVGYIFHDYACGGVPLYRVFNRHEYKYYFTTSEEKKHEKLGAGWEDGGITGFIYKP